MVEKRGGRFPTALTAASAFSQVCTYELVTCAMARVDRWAFWDRYCRMWRVSFEQRSSSVERTLELSPDFVIILWELIDALPVLTCVLGREDGWR